MKLVSLAAIASAVTADGPKVEVKSDTYTAVFQAGSSGFAISVDNSAGSPGCVDRSDWCGEWQDTSCAKDSAATKGTGGIKFGANGEHSLAVWSDGTVRFDSTSCVEVRTSAPDQTQATGLNFKSAGTRKARIFVDAGKLVINAETLANHDRVCAINEYHDADNLACASCPAGELSPAGSIGASSCAPANCADGTIASAHCTCDTGFAGGGAWVGSPTFAYPACADIDECNPNYGAIACGGASTCNNNLDHFTCTCDAGGGWEGSDVQDTTCTAITCGADQHVVGNACTDCAADSKRAAGDLATNNAGTSCDINECATNSGSGSCMYGACYDSWTDGGSTVALGAYRCDCTTGSGFSGTDCNECAAGMGYDSGEAKCVACAHPQFNDETTHNAPCVDQSCPVGSGVVTDCAGNWDTSGAVGVNCEVCGNGYISGVGSGVCTLDSANGYVDPDATKAATGCAAEWYVTGSTCTPCPVGSARATATTFASPDACAVTTGYAGGSATTDATGCAAGFYDAGTLECTTCSGAPTGSTGCGTWTAAAATGCATACGQSAGSGNAGAVSCSTGSDAGCIAVDKPTANTCASTAACGTWTAAAATGCATACGTAAGSGSAGAVSCSTGSDAGCAAGAKPSANTCASTAACGTWTAAAATGCATACGQATSGSAGTVSCSTGSDAGCNAGAKPAANTCGATAACGTWTAAAATGCATACGTAAGSGTAGAVSCSNAACDPKAKPDALTCGATAACYCASSPCFNGATCSEGNGGYLCDCTYGWTGVTCETDASGANTDLN